MSRLMIRLLDILINKQLLGSINTQFSSDMMKIYTQNDFVFYLNLQFGHAFHNLTLQNM